MATTQTTISWTDAAWNPVTGCTKVSTHPDRLDQPMRWRKPRKVFVNSMSDLFHDDVPDEFIDRVFAVMALAPQHTFQVLTKRPERLRAYMTQRVVGHAEGFHYGHRIGVAQANLIERMPKRLATTACARAVAHEGGVRIPPWPLPNVWLGVSCEDQRAADERIPLLLQTPAAVRFLSLEPLLGPIELGDYAPWFGDPRVEPGMFVSDGMVDWVIAGGESGPGARPCDVAWIRVLVEQCRAASVPCFVKQLGAKPVARDRWDMTEEQFVDLDASENGWTEADGAVVLRLRNRKGEDPAEWPDNLRVREFPGHRVDT